MSIVNWLIDLTVFFAATAIIFTVKFLLTMSKNANISVKDVTNDFSVLLGGGQISLLVISYNIKSIIDIFRLEQLKSLWLILVVVLSIGILYNVIIYVLVKEIGVYNEKPLFYTSLTFFLVSILGTLTYAVFGAIF